MTADTNCYTLYQAYLCIVLLILLQKVNTQFCQVDEVFQFLTWCHHYLTTQVICKQFYTEHNLAKLHIPVALFSTPDLHDVLIYFKM
jgi:hypothetical protein